MGPAPKFASGLGPGTGAICSPSPICAAQWPHVYGNLGTGCKIPAIIAIHVCRYKVEVHFCTWIYGIICPSELLVPGYCSSEAVEFAKFSQFCENKQVLGVGGVAVQMM